MSKTSEMSKITQERIENVFDEFVVNKIIAELDPIKEDFKRSNSAYADKTTGEFIENIYHLVGDMKFSVEKMKKSIIHQDENWKMSEQIQFVADSQTDITDDIESINENLSVLKEDVSAQLLARCDDITKNIENALNVITSQNEEEAKKTVAKLQEMHGNINTLYDEFTKEFNCFAKSNQEKINIEFASITKKIDDLNNTQRQVTDKQQEFLTEQFNIVSKKIEDSNVEQRQIAKKHSDVLNEHFDKIENVLEIFNDTENKNAQSIKSEINKSSDITIQSIGEFVAAIENTTTHNTLEIKEHICNILEKYENKIVDINSSNIKNIKFMLKILIGVSSINAIGIIIAIILNFIF